MIITHNDLVRLLKYPHELYKKLRRMKIQIPNDPPDIKFQHIYNYKILHTIWCLSLIKPHTKHLMKHDYQPPFKHKPHRNNTYNYNKEHRWRYGHYLHEYKMARRRYEHAKMVVKQFHKSQQQKIHIQDSVYEGNNPTNDNYNKNDPLGVNHFLDTVYKISIESDGASDQ